MSFALVQNVQQLVSATTTNAITVSAVKQGDLVVVNFKITSAAVTPTVTDNASPANTYAQAAAQTTSGNGNGMWQFYGVAITGGATVITINWSGSLSSRGGVNEFSGNAATNALVFDASSTGFSAGSAGGSVTAFAPAAPGKLIVAGVDINSVVTSLVAGAGYTLSNLGNTSILEEYRASSTLSETAPNSWTTSSAWEEVAASYNPANHVKFNNSGLRPYPFSPGLSR